MADSTPKLFQVDFKVMIAGVRIPETQITITSAFNAVPTCTVSMPPHPRLFGIGRQDRVPMQVYVSDTLKEPVGSQNPDDIPYLMLFDGEITGFSYASTELGKAFTVTAEAIPAFFKKVHLRLLQSAQDYIKAASNQRGSAVINIGGHLSSTFPASLFLNGIVSGTGTIEYPTQFLENIITALTTGAGLPDPDSAVVQFYNTYCNTMKISDRYTTVPLFDDTDGTWSGSGFPILQGLQSSALFNTLSGAIGSGPSQESIASLINYIVSTMEYEWATFASPAYGTTGASDKMIQMCLKPMLYEALPPACNIIFRSHVREINLNENVTDPPTRVLYRDESSLYSTSTSDSSTSSYLTTYAWPTAGEDGLVQEGINKLSNHLITLPRDSIYSEEFCGPSLFEAVAPPWMSYLMSSKERGGIDDVCVRLLKHLYILKKYETRNTSIVTAFNPYITPGFPGVVYDTESGVEGADSIKLIGQVLVVSHSLSKNNMSTHVQMGFTRLLSEEATTPLESNLPDATTMLHDPATVQQIYTKLLGTENIAMDIASLSDEPDTNLQGFKDAQKDPVAAYTYNSRNIMTQAQYEAFITQGAERFDTELPTHLAAQANEMSGKSIFKL